MNVPNPILESSVFVFYQRFYFQRISLFQKGSQKTLNFAEMCSDDDMYEDENSGYGHSGDPVQDRLDYAVHVQVKKLLQYFQDKEGNSQGTLDAVAGDFGHPSLYKILGYLSLVGLLRLHSLLGDYYQAIKVLENIELNK